MSLPPMDPGNHLSKLNNRLTKLEQHLKALRSASGTLDAATIYKGGLTVINHATTQKVKLTEAQIRFWADFAANPEDYAAITANTAGALWMEGADGGAVFLNALGVDADGNAGSAWVQASGPIIQDCGESWSAEAGEAWTAEAGTYAWLQAADYIVLDAPLVTLGAPVLVSSPSYQLGYNYDGTSWTICLITSALKYKQDIVPADVDVDAVLDIEPVRYRDKSAVEKSGEAAPLNFGVIADQVDELGLGDLLVSYVNGEIESVHYDRIAVALIPAVRKLRDRVDAQDKTIADQQTQIDALTQRLEALENQ